MKTKTLKAALATALVALGRRSGLEPRRDQVRRRADARTRSRRTRPPRALRASSTTPTPLHARLDGGLRPPGRRRGRAPKTGTIKKISVISQGPDTFRFELAKAKPASEQAKVVYRSKKLRTQGQADPNALDYTIETFKVNAPVKKGQYLATESKRSSMLRCSSGGPNQLLFQPALPLSGPFETATDTDGCWLLLEATIK